MLTLGTGVGGGARPRRRSLSWLGRARAHRRRAPTGLPARATAPAAAISRPSHPGTPPTEPPRSSGARARRAELLVGRAEEGDQEALEALAGIGHLLGIGIGSCFNIFAPELTIVGGGFGLAAAEFLFPAALDVARREVVAESARSSVRIVTAELGQDAGLIGAGLLALEALGEG